MSIDESNLTTRKAVKDWCEITADDTSVLVSGGDNLGTIIDGLIKRGSNFLVKEIGRTKLFTTPITEVRNGNDLPVIFPKVFPITAVTSVTIDSLVIPQRTSVYGSGWSFDDDAIYLDSYLFCSGNQNVSLVYQGGITTTSIEANILEQGLLEMINMKWRRRKHADQLAEKSGGIISIQFRSEDIPPETQRVIEKLRNHVPFE